jgi:hypothetical protein
MAVACAAFWSAAQPGDSANESPIAPVSAETLTVTPPPDGPTPTPTVAAPLAPSFRLYNIRDEKLLNELWKQAGREGEPEPGRYQILVQGGPEGELFLLREGTQSGTLPPTAQEWMRERLGSDGSQANGETRTLGAGFWGNFWNPVDWLAPYQWSTGLDVGARFDLAVFRRTTPLVGLHYDMSFAQRPFKWLTTEVGAHASRQGGGPRRNLYDPLDNVPGWEPWSEYQPWWHAAVGIPGVKWEVSLSNREFPEYFWLEPNAGEGTYQLGLSRAGAPFDSSEYADGVLMKRWRPNGGPPKPSGNNLAHSLHLKAGNFRYLAHFDNDMYLSTIQEFMIEEIRAPFGQWAIGFITAQGVSHSRLRLDMFPWNPRVGPRAAGARAQAYFLRLNLDYRDPSTYRMALSTNIQIDAPYLRAGDTP